MTEPKFSRRDFLKLAGTGAATTAVLTGCGPASRYVVREPYAKMPEYTYNGESTFYATTCQECSAGCGLIVRTIQGRAIKVEGNPNHPVNLGKTCARGQATLHGLYNPDRVQFPVNQNRAEKLSEEKIEWDDAISIIGEALTKYSPGEIAFLMGETHDHLFDLLNKLTTSLGAPPPLRFGALSMFEGRKTMELASFELFGELKQPLFDISQSDMVVSFGANFLETWISPVSFTRQYSQMRKGVNGKRGYMVHFEPRMSQTAAVADKWIPIKPGTETFATLALGRLIAEATGTLPEIYLDVKAEELADKAGIEIDQLQEIANRFVQSERPLVIPGSWALGQKAGLDHAKSILSLNLLADNIGRPGGVYLSPKTAIESTPQSISSTRDIENLILRIKSGSVKVLFVHGVNPVFEIPKSFGFPEAMENVELIISFASFPDETALLSDYIFPDHTGLESWGYKHILTSTPKTTLSVSQPVVVPYYDTRSTVDVILAALKTAGGESADSLPFADEVEFIQSQITPLIGESSPLIQAGEIKTFTAQIQQFGGWWSEDDKSTTPSPTSDFNLDLKEPVYQGDREFFLVPYISPILGEKGANKPWLQETPDPTTTVMWNTWVEINPQTAAELGIHDDDIVKIITDVGQIEVSAYLYPGIRPDTIGIPFGQGHTAYGRYAEGRGVNPADLLGKEINDAGDLVFATTKATIQKTGKHKQLARLESRIGVYGFEGEH
ncbi:MAG: molybdopterin-dependent oxidoreductase [Aliifodinibius sp.]|nr:molybdopterin-dependent oxidoreductase [Fodinibius sp.]